MSEDIQYWQKRAHLEIRKHYALLAYNKYSQQYAQMDRYPAVPDEALARKVDRYLTEYIETSKALTALDLAAAIAELEKQ